MARYDAPPMNYLTDRSVDEQRPATRYELLGLLASQYVLEGALDADPWASRRAGVHWQKAAISPIVGLSLAYAGAAETFAGVGAEKA